MSTTQSQKDSSLPFIWPDTETTTAADLVHVHKFKFGMQQQTLLQVLVLALWSTVPSSERESVHFNFSAGANRRHWINVSYSAILANGRRGTLEGPRSLQDTRER